MLVIPVAQDEAGRAGESLFGDELRLALDGIAVAFVDADVDRERFEALPLSEQLAVVRALLESRRGLAATWLSQGSRTSVLLHVAVFSAGRVLVRIVEGDPSRPGFATDLAMAARELLGTAYLFERAPEQESVARVVDNVRQRVSSKTRSVGWALSTAAQTEAGLGWFRGPSLTVGASLGVERGARDGWVPHLSLAGQRGFLDGTLSRDLASVAVDVGAGATYRLDYDPVRVGLALDLHLVWSSVSVQATPTSENTLGLWTVRADVGPEVRLRVVADVELLLRVNAGFYGRRRRLTLQSTGERLFDAPFVTWGAAVGVSVPL